MSMFNFVSQGYHSIMRAIGAEKPVAPAGTAAGLGLTKPQAPAEKPAEAHTFKKTESLEKSAAAQGSAKASAGDTSGEIDDWNAARSKGAPIDFSAAPKSDNKLASVIFLKDENGYAKKYTPEQRERIKGFMQEVQTKSSKLNDTAQRGKILYIMADGIDKKGMTDKQMDLIADGKFGASSYIAMVNNGDPIG